MTTSYDPNAFALTVGLGGSKTREFQSEEREFRLLAASERKRDEAQARTQEHLADLERVMNTEIQRRSERDARIQDMVESNVRLALEKMVGAWQVELTRLQRRIEAEFRDRCQQLEHETAKMKHQVSRLEGQLETSNSTCRRQAESIALLDNRVKLLEELMSRQENVRGLEDIERVSTSILLQSTAETEKVARLLRAEMGDLENRFASFEQWFGDTITPELVACRAAVEAEQRQREEADEEMANVMGRYAKIMQRHFAGGFPTGVTALLGPRAAEGMLNETDSPSSP